ncbi:MAG: hypothetical protein GEV08_23995 [Acidimicrobiia bacterium]|nr:hypothetical protein [Acidimicrobiia bacterium]
MALARPSAMPAAPTGLRRGAFDGSGGRAADCRPMAPGGDAPPIDLDHLAVAAEQAFDNFARYFADLGGRVGHGGHDPGFHWSQVVFPNATGGETAVELLEPEHVHEHDFLRRFLDRNGPGPHHVTFRVRDLAARLAAVEGLGYQAVSVDLEHPSWKQAFLHPKQSHGIVVQLSQSDGEPAPGPDPSAFVLPRAALPAELRRVTLAVADHEAALDLFGVALGGEQRARGEDVDGSWADLVWPGGGAIRLLAPVDPAVAAWVGMRIGRVHHVVFAVDEPAAVPGARPRGEGAWEVPPEHNLGTRLRLVRR